MKSLLFDMNRGILATSRKSKIPVPSTVHINSQLYSGASARHLTSPLRAEVPTVPFTLTPIGPTSPSSCFGVWPWALLSRPLPFDSSLVHSDAFGAMGIIGGLLGVGSTNSFSGTTALRTFLLRPRLCDC